MTISASTSSDSICNSPLDIITVSTNTLLPNVIVPPKSVNVLAKSNKSKAAAGTRTRALIDSMAGEELIWNVANQGVMTTTVTNNDTNTENNAADMAPLDMSNIGGDDDDVPYDDYGAGDNNDYGDFTNIPISDATVPEGSDTPLSTGLAINQNNLVQAGRMVQKIDIK